MKTPTLKAIEAAVEARTRALAPEALYNMVLRRHCRRGIREGCDCDYCTAKRQATAAFTFDVGLALQRYPDTPDSGRIRYSSCSDYDDRWWIKQTIRNRIRAEARAKLKAIREA